MLVAGAFRHGCIVTSRWPSRVVLTAVSVTVGMVRPDIADVDALVAGTLIYAGVAGLVIALDLAHAGRCSARCWATGSTSAT